MNQCPVCGYVPGLSSPYDNLTAFGGYGLQNRQYLGAQMQAMDKNYMHLSDEEYDLIWARRDKKRRIEKAQEIEREVWNPELLEGK